MEFDVKWHSGFFDGEGSIGVYARNSDKKKTIKYFVLVVSLAQSGNIGKIIVEKLKEVFGGTVYINKSSRGKVQWKWNISADKAVVFLEYVLPHLQIKGVEATLALDFQELNNKRFDNDLATQYANQIKQCKVNY